MSHPLQLAFSSLLLPIATSHGPFRVKTGNDCVWVAGHLSAGGRDWVLDARANLHRRKITLCVSATQTTAGAIRSVEDHGYQAYVGSVKPGRYEIHVIHRFVSPMLESGVHSWPVHSELIEIGTPARPRAAVGTVIGLLGSLSLGW